MKGQPEAMSGSEGAVGRRYKMGRRGIGSLKTRVGRECSISRGGQIVQ